MAKYSYEFKLQVVQAYLDINLSIDNFLNDRQSTYVSIILLLSSVGTYFEKKERM